MMSFATPPPCDRASGEPISRRPAARLSAALLAAACFTVIPASAVSSAELVRNVPHRYGRFEARIRFAAGDGIVSSFFLWKDGSERPGTAWNEIDIEKVGLDCHGYSSNAIYGAPASHHTERIRVVPDLCAEYHTHAIEWTPSLLRWLLDDVEVRRVDAAALEAFERDASAGLQARFNLWLGDESFGGHFTPASLPARQYIDWIAYAAYTPAAGSGGGDFTPVWREECRSPLGASWSFGTWDSPLGHSTHVPANVGVADDACVLSLTADAGDGLANGSSDAAATGGAGAAGSATAAGGGSGVAGASAGTSVVGAADGSGRRRAQDAGCALRAASGSSAARAWLLGAMALALATLRGWQARRWSALSRS